MNERPAFRPKKSLAMIVFCTLPLVFEGLFAWGQSGVPSLDPSPKQIVVSPELLKDPPSFKGSGFKAGEAVTVELGLPQGLKLKGMTQEEPWVGIAFAKADEKGEFQCKMASTAILNWFLQVDWTPDGKPDMTKVVPLPPGSYRVRAVGMDSDVVAETGLEILSQAK
jgi:hypothetical protein